MLDRRIAIHAKQFNKFHKGDILQTKHGEGNVVVNDRFKLEITVETENGILTFKYEELLEGTQKRKPMEIKKKTYGEFMKTHEQINSWRKQHTQIAETTLEADGKNVSYFCISGCA